MTKIAVSSSLNSLRGRQNYTMSGSDRPGYRNTETMTGDCLSAYDFHQIFGGGDEIVPEKTLWFAVLEDAVRLIARLSQCRKRKLLVPKFYLQDTQRAVDWIHTASGDVGGFGWVCELFSIDVSYLRDRLMSAVDGTRILPSPSEILIRGDYQPVEEAEA